MGFTSGCYRACVQPQLEFMPMVIEPPERMREYRAFRPSVADPFSSAVQHAAGAQRRAQGEQCLVEFEAVDLILQLAGSGSEGGFDENGRFKPDRSGLRIIFGQQSF